MHKKRLPIGIQYFRDFKTWNYQYVDKTEQIYQLTQGAKYYFLSRPRRFGKSLLLSTMKELFVGSRDLFEGLWVESRWDWSAANPVIHLSFASMDYQGLGLAKAINLELEKIAAHYHVEFKADSYKFRFQQLIEQLATDHGPVVILIDEYDKPIIDYLEKDRLDEARANQEVMKIFYSVLKDAAPYLRMVFITGVSKFTKVSIFSDLNHLKDITLDRDFATLTGYTQSELEANFASYLQELADFHQLPLPALLDKMRVWYNGYSWDGIQKVYNPFGTLSFLGQKDFGNYWFSTGTPTLLINMMRRQVKFDYERVATSAALLDKYSLDNLDMTSLLFQTGYLTIIERDPSNSQLVLDYPNFEVRDSMYGFLIDALAPNRDQHHAPLMVSDLRRAFEKNDLAEVRYLINTLLSDLPYDLFAKDLPTSERFYHSIIHLLFKYLGVFIDSEVHTHRGRADSVVQTATHVYLFEFKHDQSADIALQQIKDKQYAEKYRNTRKTIVGIGVNYVFDTRKVEGWLEEVLV
jgi:Predicted AAA-ATPase/PD-(D/E)XK nuclease superfamily